MIGAMMVLTGKWNKPGVYNVEEFDPIHLWRSLINGASMNEISTHSLLINKKAFLYK